MVDNRKYGYTFSVALHILIALAMFAWALLDVLFPEELTENKIVFDMVEPSPNPPEPPPPPPSTPDKPLVTDKIEKIEPLDIKPIEKIEQPEDPEPEPNEPVVKLPSPDKPKPKPKPPKKVSFKDFKPKISATNRKTSTNKQTRRNIKIDTIRSTHTSIDSIVTSTTATPSSSYMKDALSEYYKHIYIKAKSNWKCPTINVDTLSVKVSFHISKTGIISNVRIIKSSGDKDFDESVIQVFRSITIDPPPDNKPQTINIIFNAS